MAKLKGNRLGIAVEVDRIPGFEQESLSTAAFGGRQSDGVFAQTEIGSARRFLRFVTNAQTGLARFDPSRSCCRGKDDPCKLFLCAFCTTLYHQSY